MDRTLPTTTFLISASIRVTVSDLLAPDMVMDIGIFFVGGFNVARILSAIFWKYSSYNLPLP